MKSCAGVRRDGPRPHDHSNPGRRSEDTASVHGTAALPTELNGASPRSFSIEEFQLQTFSSHVDALFWYALANERGHRL